MGAGSRDGHLDQEEVLSTDGTRLMPTPGEVGHEEDHTREGSGQTRAHAEHGMSTVGLTACSGDRVSA